MTLPKTNEFVFLPKYRVWRHLTYWSCHIVIWAIFWIVTGSGYSFPRQVFSMIVWTPVFIFFGYPLVYGAIPRLLLQGKVWQFLLVGVCWAIAGLLINGCYRYYVYVPLQQYLELDHIYAQKTLMPLPSSYLCMTTAVATPMVIRFFKLWTIKQRDLMLAQQERITAQLQLLKAQVHPHFLFNTLNNIYALAMESSPRTPEMILKLSSLLSYMLYDCRDEQVLLEKEVDIMKNYIDLEKERYGDKIDISVNIEGDIQDRYITPLLILPFLENAFKHGTSEQLEKPWMSVDIVVKDHQLKCKVVNSKDQFVPFHENGVGINNVKKRLELLYLEKHEIKLKDEGDFFVVSLLLNLKASSNSLTGKIGDHFKRYKHEDPLPVN